jgi:hypothetical protein
MSEMASIELQENIGRQRELTKTRIYIIWARYLAGGMIVGGATVSLGLLMSPSPMHPEVYIAFTLLFGGLFVSIGWCRTKTLRLFVHGGRYRVRSLLTITFLWVVGVFFISGSLFLTTRNPPYRIIEPYTLPWWRVIGYALALTIVGTVLRIGSDNSLRLLDNESDDLEHQVNELSHRS